MDIQTALSEFDMVLRLCLGFLAGAVIGFERSSRRQVAGLRTHILITTGSTLLMLLSIYIPQHFHFQTNSDPGRIAAQVVSGMGFLGAGAIIRLGHNIRGLTTAASLWFSAAVGLAIGGGMFLVAGAAVVLGMVTLIPLYFVERKIFPTERLKLLDIYYKKNSTSTKEALDLIKAHGIDIQTIDVYQSSKDEGTRLRLLVMIPGAVDITSVARAIKDAKTVSKVEIKEKY